MKRIIVLLCFLAQFAFGMNAQSVSLSTNLLDYADMGTLNIEASYGFARHWSVDAGLKYNPFTYGSGDTAVQRRQRTVTAGARWWPWHIYSGWWVSGNARYQEYNKGGGAEKPQTWEGDRVGAGLRGGYSLMLNPHLNMDFGLGVWAGYDVYTVYECQQCGRVVANGAKYFVLPSDFILSVSYIF